ncbi:hypothetical protein SCUP515_10273 [Seiridium cupressi]
MIAPNHVAGVLSATIRKIVNTLLINSQFYADTLLFSSKMTMDRQHTLWLWTEGAFSRRVMYTLLIKGLVDSATDLLQGKTTRPDLRINPVKIDTTKGWVCGDSADPQPEGASNPCMRTTDMSTGKTWFIYESTSIILYLEGLYPEHPMQPKSAVERAMMMDMVGKINITALETNYFLRNTVPDSNVRLH